MDVKERIAGTLGLGKELGVKARGEVRLRDARVTAMAAPGCVSFEPVRHMEIDGAFRRAYAIRDFATLNVAGWAREFQRTPGARGTIVVRPADGEAIRRALDHADARAGVSLVSGGSASKTVDSQINRDHARTQLQMMADTKKAFVNASFTYQIEAPSAEELGAQYRQIRDTARPRGFTVDPCARAQERVLRSCDPMNTKDDAYLTPRFSIDMPSDTLAASQPFSCGGIIDTGGIVLGTDESGSMVRVNMFETTPGRTNYNVGIWGQSGSGKSFLLKKQVLKSYADGHRIIWIDPEQEGKNMAKRLSGQYINAGGGSRAMLSPLQPRALNFDYDDDGAGGEGAVGVLRSTMNFVRGFYQLAFLTPTAWLPHLDKALVAAYGAHGLTYDTCAAEVDYEDYPTMDELASVMRRMAEEERRPKVAQILDELAEQTSTGGKDGIFGNLWSARTNISLTSDFVVFDVGSLMSGNVSSSAKNGQLLSILSFIWSEVCRARCTGRPLRIVCDECHLLLGSDTDTAADAGACDIAAALLAMISRRARKYNCGLTIATQTLSQFLDPTIRRHGEAIIDNCTYQFAFATKSTEAVRELMHIPEAQARRLPEYQKGWCIMKAGHDMCKLHVEDNPLEHPWFGNAGGK